MLYAHQHIGKSGTGGGQLAHEISAIPCFQFTATELACEWFDRMRNNVPGPVEYILYWREHGEPEQAREAALVRFDGRGKGHTSTCTIRV